VEALVASGAAWSSLAIPGVMRRQMAVNPDERGSFGELWRDGWTADLPGSGDTPRMLQANLSRSHARVLRGLHLHLRQADLWIVVDGHPFVALVDVRPMTSGHEGPIVEGIEAGPGDSFYLPAGVAHGFYAHDPITLVYLVTNEYDSTDELGFVWDDPDAAVPWPDRQPILSARDATAPPLAQLLDRLTTDDRARVPI
jgi:dTDP-4-dehydrorhamnose 3,5-epimerase